MFWVVLFAAIAVIAIIVAVVMLRWLYLRFRALLSSVNGFGAKIAAGAEALARIDTAQVFDQADPDIRSTSGNVTVRGREVVDLGNSAGRHLVPLIGIEVVEPMAPLIGAPSIWTLLIILALALLLFGGSRLAGLGKSTGKAIREFKEETKGLGDGGSEQTVSAPVEPGQSKDTEPVEAELVDPPKNNTDR